MTDIAPGATTFVPLENESNRAVLCVYITTAAMVVLTGWDSYLRSTLQESGHVLSRGDQISVAVTCVLFITFKVITAAFVCRWMYRACLNAMAMVPEGTFAKDAKSVGFMAVTSWFIPVWNLWKPYEGMVKLWRASNPRTADGADWQKNKLPKELPIWWACWVATQLVGYVAGQMPGGSWVIGFQGVATIVPYIIAGLLFANIIKSITERQHQFVHMREAGQ